MSRRKGFSSFDVLFASLLVVIAFVLASSALSSRLSSIAFFDQVSLTEEKAFVFSEKLVKSCSSGLAFCENGFTRSHVLENRFVVLNKTGFVVLALDGHEVFSQGEAKGFCVNRLSVFNKEAVVVRACFNG